MQNLINIRTLYCRSDVSDNTQMNLKKIKNGLTESENKVVRFFMPEEPGEDAIHCYEILTQNEGTNKDLVKFTYFNTKTKFFHQEIKQMHQSEWYAKYKYANGI